MRRTAYYSRTAGSARSYLISIRPWRRPPSLAQGEHNLAKPNFGYQKRQKELEKKRKKEEKLKKRQERAAAAPVEGQPPAPETPEPV